MDRMKEVFIVLAFLFGFNGLSQSLDSVSYSYDNVNQELTGYINGYFPWGASHKDITQINDSIANDTVFIDIHYLPCDIWPTFTYYDTTFILNIYISPGSKIIRTRNIRDQYLDSNSCFYFPQEEVVAKNFTPLNVPIGVNEYTNENILIYPNPVTQSFKIEKPFALSLENVRVLDYSGKLIHQFKSTEQSFDVSNLNPGLYIVEIKTDKGVLRKKMLKE
ncbi:MAG: hypothetical protein SchgKO_10510 [Schleiferiaceae bacterium]